MFDGKYAMWGGGTLLQLQAMLNYLGLDMNSNSRPRIPARKWRLASGPILSRASKPQKVGSYTIPPIGLMLNAKYPDRSIMPRSPVQRIAAHLLGLGGRVVAVRNQQPLVLSAADHAAWFRQCHR